MLPNQFYQCWCRTLWHQGQIHHMQPVMLHKTDVKTWKPNPVSDTTHITDKFFCCESCTSMKCIRSMMTVKKLSWFICGPALDADVAAHCSVGSSISFLNILLITLVYNYHRPPPISKQATSTLIKWSMWATIWVYIQPPAHGQLSEAPNNPLVQRGNCLRCRSGIVKTINQELGVKHCSSCHEASHSQYQEVSPPVAICIITMYNQGYCFLKVAILNHLSRCFRFQWHRLPCQKKTLEWNQGSGDDKIGCCRNQSVSLTDCQ